MNTIIFLALLFIMIVFLTGCAVFIFALMTGASFRGRGFPYSRRRR